VVWKPTNQRCRYSKEISWKIRISRNENEEQPWGMYLGKDWHIIASIYMVLAFRISI
jgi:hypothetical protein